MLPEVPLAAGMPSSSSSLSSSFFVTTTSSSGRDFDLDREEISSTNATLRPPSVPSDDETDPFECISPLLRSRTSGSSPPERFEFDCDGGLAVRLGENPRRAIESVRTSGLSANSLAASGVHFEDAILLSVGGSPPLLLWNEEEDDDDDDDDDACLDDVV